MKKIYIGSYNKGIFETKIKDNKLLDITKISNLDKVSYFMDYHNTLSFLYLKDGLQYIKIGNQDLLLGEGACHISYDIKHELIYVSFYGDGLLKVLSKTNDNLWIIDEVHSFGEKSRVHYASYIDTIDMVGVCDLGLNTFTLYKVNDTKLTSVTSYQFNNNEGPRHFTYNTNNNLIYVLNELNPSVTTFQFNNNELILKDNIVLEKGAGSAIRLTKDNKYLFAAVRFSNVLYSFEVKKDGLLEVVQKVDTLGDHPRDFNLINDDSLLVIANMKTDNLTTYCIKDGKLELKESDVYLNAGCTIIEL